SRRAPPPRCSPSSTTCSSPRKDRALARRAPGRTARGSTRHFPPPKEDEMGLALELLKDGFRKMDADDVDGFVAMQAADCEWSTPDGLLEGPEAVREYVQRWHDGFPGGVHTIERSYECGESTVVAEGTWRGARGEAGLAAHGPALVPRAAGPDPGAGAGLGDRRRRGRQSASSRSASRDRRHPGRGWAGGVRVARYARSRCT